MSKNSVDKDVFFAGERLVPQAKVPKTVRVRIAVAINKQGQWNASGYFKWDDEGAKDTALTGLDEPGMEAGGESIVFVEADVPLPTEPTIQGKVAAPLAQDSGWDKDCG